MSGALPSGRRGQVLAVSLTAVVAAALWVGVVTPLIGAYREQLEYLDSRRILAGRMIEVVATLPGLRRQAGDIAVAGPSANALLDGASDAVAAARVQEIIQAMALKSGTAVSSLETLPNEQVGAYHRIALRVTVSAAWLPLVGLLQSIEVSTPRLLIDDIRLTGSRLAGRTGPNTLDATFTVIGFRASGEDTRAGLSR